MALRIHKRLAAILLIVVIGAVLFVSSETLRSKRSRQCLNNLAQIDGAVSGVALEQQYQRAQFIQLSALTNYLLGSRLPRCPSGGQYFIPLVGARPTCSVHGDLLRRFYALTNCSQSR